MSTFHSKKRSSLGGFAKTNPKARFRGAGKDKDGVWLNPYRNSTRIELVMCHFCGYGPPEEPADGICPKCGKHAWEHSIVSKRLLPLKEEE